MENKRLLSPIPEKQLITPDIEMGKIKEELKEHYKKDLELIKQLDEHGKIKGDERKETITEFLT